MVEWRESWCFWDKWDKRGCFWNLKFEDKGLLLMVPPEAWCWAEGLRMAFDLAEGGSVWRSTLAFCCWLSWRALPSAIFIFSSLSWAWRFLMVCFWWWIVSPFSNNCYLKLFRLIWQKSICWVACFNWPVILTSWSLSFSFLSWRYVTLPEMCFSRRALSLFSQRSWPSSSATLFFSTVFSLRSYLGLLSDCLSILSGNSFFRLNSCRFSTSSSPSLILRLSASAWLSTSKSYSGVEMSASSLAGRFSLLKVLARTKGWSWWVRLTARWSWPSSKSARKGPMSLVASFPSINICTDEL